MKAVEAGLLAFLKKSPQFVIPIYQRTYSWTEKECRQLWDDVLRAGRTDGISVHFIGSIVYIEDGLSQVSHQSPLLVIDGQQRLTTVTLLIAALAQMLGDDEPVEGFSARKLRNYYLLNPEESGERHYKLLLSQTDKASLLAIVGQQPAPHAPSLRVEQNFALFIQLLEGCKGDFRDVCRGLGKLVVVDIALSREHDNPQLIFESMNSTGRELSQADLIRNYILMGLPPDLQTRLYEQYWRPMEVSFGQEAYNIHFDSFMRHYLTVRTGEIPRLSDVYEAFKSFANSSQSMTSEIEKLVNDLRATASHYCAMALGTETDPKLKRAFADLRELKVDVAYPFLLELYEDYAAERLSRDDFLEAIRLAEAYVFRRAICMIPTNSLNKTFATMTKSVRKDRYLESIKAHLISLPSYRRYPSDEEFERELQVRDLYHFRSRSYWLRRLENHDRKEYVPVDEYTIEHIMPQNENVPAAWRASLGPDWQRIHSDYLHTLGNLTLTGYNSEYSDNTFAQKRDMVGGFRHSPLRVNEGLGELADWNESAIKARARRLAKQASAVWPGVSLSEEVLATYRKVAAPRDLYTIADHPHLTRPPMEALFHQFRQEIKALDPCVSEEFLKLYVAYKAETNFVDVVPQAKQLRLSINIKFADLIDPRGMAKDVTSLGRWGNGDVEVGLSNSEDLPYVVGLVRQALDLQLGSEVGD